MGQANYYGNPYADFDRWDAEQSRLEDLHLAICDSGTTKQVSSELRYLLATGKLSIDDLLVVAAQGLSTCETCSGLSAGEDKDAWKTVERIGDLVMDELHDSMKHSNV